MAPVLAMEPLRNSVFALVGAILLLALFLAVERAYAALKRFRIARREPALTRLVHRAVQNPSTVPREFRRLSRFDRKLVRSMLLGLAPDLKGEAGDVISTLYRDLRFLKADLRSLKAWRATKRANAAADLGLVHCGDAVLPLLHALDDPDTRVRQAAVWAVGQVGTPAALAGLVRLLGDPCRVVSHRAQEVLAERGREVVDALLAYAENTASRSGRLAAIELLGWLRIPTAAELFLTFMSDMDPEVRIKSVKAAAAVGDPRFLEIFHDRLQDSSWGVRCQAAKGLSLFGSPESVDRLAAALRDPQWWVRFYAATALAECGPAGGEALCVAQNDRQPEVREMARYLLERGAMIPALP